LNRKGEVLARVRAGELSLRKAAAELGCSFSWVRYLADSEQLERKREIRPGAVLVYVWLRIQPPAAL
jgi:hypothetical protein